MNFSELKQLLDEKYDEYCTKEFIADDPVSIPHKFTMKEDIEISGFFAALLAWGQRPQIIKSTGLLMQMMDYEPYHFIIKASAKDIKPFERFYYRTFNGTDCTFFIHTLKNIYINHQGLENVFTTGFNQHGDIRNAITYFRNIFFKIQHVPHNQKHISDPQRNSACKRLNLFLRWMVRSNDRGVDFGLWKGIPASALYCPLDVHTGNTSRELGLLNIKMNNWKAVCELTENLKKFDPADPVKYDFSLFGLGFYNNIRKFTLNL